MQRQCSFVVAPVVASCRRRVESICISMYANGLRFYDATTLITCWLLLRAACTCACIGALCMTNAVALPAGL
jgi:hypothetical protein